MSPAIPSSRSRRSASTSSPSRIRSPALSWITRSVMLSHSGVAYSGWLPTSRYSRAPLRRNTLLLRPHETTRRNRYRATSSGDSRRWPRNVHVTPYSFSSPNIRLSIRTQLPVDGYVLGLGELEQSLVRALPPEAGLLDPTEWRGRVRDDPPVNSHHARFQCLCNLKSATQVLTVEIGHQTVLGVVGLRDRLVDVSEPDDRCYRPEDLLRQDPGTGGNAVQHSRQVVEARPVRRLAASKHPGSGPRSRVDELHYFRSGVSVHKRAEFDAVLESRADLQCTQPRCQLGGELACDLFVHIEPVSRGAGLAAVAHLGQERTIHGGVDVRVIQHEERRVATQLHRAVDDVVGRLLQEHPPDLSRPGER